MAVFFEERKQLISRGLNLPVRYFYLIQLIVLMKLLPKMKGFFVRQKHSASKPRQTVAAFYKESFPNSHPRTRFQSERDVFPMTSRGISNGLTRLENYYLLHECFPVKERYRFPIGSVHYVWTANRSQVNEALDVYKTRTICLCVCMYA